MYVLCHTYTFVKHRKSAENLVLVLDHACQLKSTGIESATYTRDF